MSRLKPLSCIEEVCGIKWVCHRSKERVTFSNGFRFLAKEYVNFPGIHLYVDKQNEGFRPLELECESLEEVSCKLLAHLLNPQSDWALTNLRVAV